VEEAAWLLDCCGDLAQFFFAELLSAGWFEAGGKNQPISELDFCLSLNGDQACASPLLAVDLNAQRRI